jgi:hypothetical protein
MDVLQEAARGIVRNKECGGRVEPPRPMKGT